MLALALTLLAAAPSAAGLAGSQGLRGSLVRVQYEGEVQAELPLSQMTREQLRAEQRRLEENRPGIGGQITAVALGGVCIFAGVVTLWGSLLIGLGGTVPIAGVVIGLGLVFGGGGLLVFGLVMLRMAINERRPFNEAMDEIQQRLEGRWEEEQNPQQRPPPPPYDPRAPLPPPPPPPPAAGFDSVPARLLVATF